MSSSDENEDFDVNVTMPLKVRMLTETIRTMRSNHAKVIEAKDKQIVRLANTLEEFILRNDNLRAKTKLLQQSITLTRQMSEDGRVGQNKNQGPGDKLKPVCEMQIQHAICLTKEGEEALCSLPSLVRRIERAANALDRSLIEIIPPAETDDQPLASVETMDEDHLEQPDLIPAANSPLPPPAVLDPEQNSQELTWTGYLNTVGAVKEKLALNPRAILVHRDGSDESLMDLSEAWPERYPRQTYLLPKKIHEDFLKSTTSTYTYAVGVFPEFMKKEFTLFCTCCGSERGKAADGHPRASLPKEALDCFIDHCVFFAVKRGVDTETAILKKGIKKALNTALQEARKKNNLVPTEAQLQSYNAKHKRGAINP